jgi:hypothetical protein
MPPPVVFLYRCSSSGQFANLRVAEQPTANVRAACLLQLPQAGLIEKGPGTLGQKAA